MSENLPYSDRLRLIKLGLLPKEAVAKKKQPIKKVSDKKKAELEAEKKERGGEDSKLDKFFENMRKKMVGVCQCGCARKSSKFENDYYRASISHIFPKSIFKSIATNELNWVERNFWDGCHSNMDNRSMELWVNFADWDDIKEKFYQLSTLLTEDEKSNKFYTQLEKLIYGQI